MGKSANRRIAIRTQKENKLKLQQAHMLLKINENELKRGNMLDALAIVVQNENNENKETESERKDMQMQMLHLSDFYNTLTSNYEKSEQDPIEKYKKMAWRNDYLGYGNSNDEEADEVLQKRQLLHEMRLNTNEIEKNQQETKNMNLVAMQLQNEGYDTLTSKSVMPHRPWVLDRKSSFLRLHPHAEFICNEYNAIQAHRKHVNSEICRSTVNSAELASSVHALNAIKAPVYYKDVERKPLGEDYLFFRDDYLPNVTDADDRVLLLLDGLPKENCHTGRFTLQELRDMLQYEQ